MSAVDIIIPTWNNNEYLFPCIRSLIRNSATEDLFKIIIVNNGHPDNMEPFSKSPQIEILQMKENVGWEGGLQAGLSVSKAPYVVFMNDDTYVPPCSRLWINQLLQHMKNEKCAAVGPSSNVVMGPQNIFHDTESNVLNVPFLIFFCVMLRRSDVDAAGGVDNTLPGGDDIDLSIRLKALGKYLLIDREVFIYHHGFKSGARKMGDFYNSVQMVERTNEGLIRKHGLKAFAATFMGYGQEASPEAKPQKEDSEGDVVRKYVTGKNVMELGCGNLKTVPDSIGVDMIPNGERIPGLKPNLFSVADIVSNVESEIPVPHETFDTVIARHVLEHCVDVVGALQLWGQKIKRGGRLIIAVPDQTRHNTIPMNFQHVHAFTPGSLKSLMESQGWKIVGIEDSGNGVSFVGAFEKAGLN